MLERIRNMTMTNYRTALIAYIRQQARPVDKFSHQPRLYHLAAELAQGLEHDDDVLFAAAWLHDLGVFVGHRPEDALKLAAWDHVAYVLQAGPAVLRRLGFPAGKIPAVLEAIRTHQPGDIPTSVEATVLRDADILEQLGAVAAMRTVSKVGRDTRFATFGDALAVLERNLSVLPRQLRLPAAMELATSRIATLEAFLAAARAEAGSIPW